jgi:hemerythrin
MALFTWNEKYSVNNEELDEHHKALFDMLNKSYENCMYSDNVNCLEQIIDELVAYSYYHIPAEEQHMRDIEYNGIDEHISEHRNFTHRTLQLKQDLNNDDFDASKEMIVFLGNWLLNHVLIEDKKYSVEFW